MVIARGNVFCTFGYYPGTGLLRWLLPFATLEHSEQRQALRSKTLELHMPLVSPLIVWDCRLPTATVFVPPIARWFQRVVALFRRGWF